MKKIDTDYFEIEMNVLSYSYDHLTYFLKYLEKVHVERNRLRYGTNKDIHLPSSSSPCD